MSGAKDRDVCSAAFVPGDKVRVNWVNEQVEATVAEALRPTRIRSQRFFYRVAIPGVKGLPIYEDCEIARG